ncbi:nucleotidyltransferase domain-containing protein [Sulfolobus sp. S-194]|uniref:nucleotidyltransferase domain-containing protein n=1 Tax=Sulfolobus sp. S-194 TaxID=2512240 RepID=UPI0014372687|nr:nucleotidyltransferase domain-containing protein [Sulfolobus sp. S-194]QIW24459.1 nucleotidyltransferase domain-containing protein [Sulfolobus sp. S-194]
MVEDLLRSINQRLESQFSEFLNELIKLYPSSTIVLFGSRASGKNRPNSDFDVILFIECDNPLHKMIEIYSKTQPTFPIDIIVIRPSEVNENNVHLSHMLYYGYKVLHDGLGLKTKIEEMVIKNLERVREIAKYDDKKKQ